MSLLCRRIFAISSTKLANSGITGFVNSVRKIEQKVLCQNLINGHNLVFTCQSHSNYNKDYGKEIYHGPLAPRIRSVKLFSLTTSFCGILVQPLIVQNLIQGDANMVATIFSGIIVNFFTFVTPLLLHYVTKRYVKTMYYNEETDTYTSITYNFWIVDSPLTFNSDDVTVPDIPGLFTSIIVKGVPLFIEAGYFQQIHHYKKIMGFDKPIDFKLKEKPEE